MEVQTPPQFTLEEVITLDFSDAGGGNPGVSKKSNSEPTKEKSTKNEITQKENSDILIKSTNSDIVENNKSKVINPQEDPKPKNDFSDLFGKGNGDSKNGEDNGEGNGFGVGKGPNIGGGIGDGKGRQVIGNPELDNPKNWVGFVMVQFIINQNGDVIDTKVLYPHNKTTITLSSIDQNFIEEDCKIKFKFSSSSSSKNKERLVKRIQYIEK